MNATKRAPGVVSRINKALAAAGREERLVRGRGYYYVAEGESSGFPSTSIYVYRLGPDDFDFAAREVSEIFKAAGIAVELHERAGK